MTTTTIYTGSLVAPKEDVLVEGDKHFCNEGWIHYQHPLKPLGVYWQTRMCPYCNANGEKPLPQPTFTWTMGDGSSSKYVPPGTLPTSFTITTTKKLG